MRKASCHFTRKIKNHWQIHLLLLIRSMKVRNTNKEKLFNSQFTTITCQIKHRRKINNFFRYKKIQTNKTAYNSSTAWTKTVRNSKKFKEKTVFKIHLFSNMTIIWDQVMNTNLSIHNIVRMKKRIIKCSLMKVRVNPPQ